MHTNTRHTFMHTHAHILYTHTHIFTHAHTHTHTHSWLCWASSTHVMNETALKGMSWRANCNKQQSGAMNDPSSLVVPDMTWQDFVTWLYPSLCVWWRSSFDCSWFSSHSFIPLLRDQLQANKLTQSGKFVDTLQVSAMKVQHELHDKFEMTRHLSGWS